MPARRRGWNPAVPLCLATLFVIFAAGHAVAQEDTSSSAGSQSSGQQQSSGWQPPDTTGLGATSTAIQATEASQPSSAIVGPTPASGPAVAPRLTPFRYGPVLLHPHLSYAFTYGNGLRSGPGQQQNSIIQTVSPGMTLNLGSHWNLDYTPTLSYYSDPHFKDTLSHSVSLNGGTSYGDWLLGLSQSVLISSQPVVETARQTSQQSYNTALDATYQINTPLSLELGAAQNINDASGYANAVGSTRTWSTMDWLNYQWGPNLGTAGGAGFGYVSTQLGGDSTYEDIQGRITWHVFQKVSVSVSGGADIRQYLDSPASAPVSPIFAATLVYQPFEQTTLSLSVSRTVSESTYYIDQLTEATGFSAALRQRLLGRFFLGLSGGYANTTYKTTVPGYSVFSGFSINREDNYSFFRVDLSTAMLGRGTASVFYSKSDNSTNLSGYGYTSDQVGFSLAYGF